MFWDNLQVTHSRGALLEESSFYPFGLKMAGISSQAAGKLQNKDKTFQGQKFDDDLGVDWYSFKWRNHDAQIGRFIEVDPLSEKYEYNSTYAFSENKVTSHVELEGLEAVSANPVADFIVNKVFEWGMNISNGKENLISGANEKAASVTGQYSEQPAVAQSFHNVNSEVKMAAGLAEMNKPGLDVVSTIAGMTVGVEIPAAAPLVTGSSFGFKGSVSLSGNAVKLGETGVSLAANATKGGIKTANGIEITGFAKHGLNRAIERGVKPDAILGALKNPLKTGKITTDDVGRQSQRFIGKLGEVVVNPQTGKIISVNPTSTDKAAKLLKQSGQ